MEIAGFDEFELDIEEAFRLFLPPFIERVDAAPLTPENISAIPGKKNGIYILLENDQVRYIGKTDSKAGFINRLTRHATHVQHRKNLNPASISFKAIAIPVFKNADIESMLIDLYKASWNFSGFGSNDPGRQRDTQEPANFDLLHPIDVDIPLPYVRGKMVECATLMKMLSVNLPYTFRCEKKHEDMSKMLTLPKENMTMREVMQLVVNALPAESKWQATFLYGRVILYPEYRDYQHAQFILRGNMSD